MTNREPDRSAIETAPRRRAAIEEARQLAQAYGLTAEELTALETKGLSPWERQRRIALDHCRQMAEFWKMTSEELRGPLVLESPEKPPKYQHPVTGQTWNGDGLQPDWLKRALLQDGYRVDELRVDSA